MKLTIEIEMDNARFWPCPCKEVARILRQFAKTVSSHVWNPLLTGDPKPLTDSKGNTVGRATIEDKHIEWEKEHHNGEKRKD